MELKENHVRGVYLRCTLGQIRACVRLSGPHSASLLCLHLPGAIVIAGLSLGPNPKLIGEVKNGSNTKLRNNFVCQPLPYQGVRPGDGPREGITQAVSYMDELWRDGCIHHDPLAWPISSPPHPPEPTCRRSSPGRSPGAPGSWVSPWTRRSRRERWSAAGARRRPCRRRGRRAARGCTRAARGQKTCAGPCGTWSGCKCRPGPGGGCRRRRTRCAAAGTSRPRCRPWRRPGSGSPGSPHSQSLGGSRKWGWSSVLVSPQAAAPRGDLAPILFLLVATSGWSGCSPHLLPVSQQGQKPFPCSPFRRGALATQQTSCPRTCSKLLHLIK